MDHVSKETLQVMDEMMYHDAGPHSPMRARRRQSDAKWRASVATCYDTLKHVVPKGQSTSKRKVSKAVILQESERHILELESVLSKLINPDSDSHSNRKAVLWKGDNQWSRCSLQHFQDDFVERQHKIFHSSNQGRRCYNLLDEIKEEIFSMTVDPDTIDIVDKEFVSAGKCVDKVSGKEISVLSQMPLQCARKETPTTEKNYPYSGIARQRNLNIPDNYSDENFVASKVLAQYFETEEQTVPNFSSPLPPQSHRGVSDVFYQSTFSTPTLSSPLSMYDHNKSCMKKEAESNIVHKIPVDRDQEVPCVESASTVGNYMPSGGTAVDFLGKLSCYIKNMDTSLASDTKMEIHRKPETQALALLPKLFHSSGTTTALDGDKVKTPGNSISIEKFKEKCWHKSTLPRPYKEKSASTKPATARKLDFNKPEFVSIHQKCAEQRGHLQEACASPMLACFTPVKLAPNITYCITCKRPDEETLVSPWKPFNSPLHGITKKKEKSPMIDPDNSLFCFESMDSILAKDDIDDERTPALHYIAGDGIQTKQPFKRKISGKGVDVQDKSQPKCRKRLEGLYDLSVNKWKNSGGNMCHWKSSCCANEEAQVVPDCKRVVIPQRDDNDGTEQTFYQYHNEDTTDFDGFYFYFRQISQQLKHQNMSREEIQSPSVAAKVLKMWMRLPSPDKQTIKTLALLESQGLCPSLQVQVGGLSQDLQDVDVLPIDMKEFIPPTTSPL